MRVPKLLGLLLLAFGLGGCEAMRNDRILGDKPFQPATAGGLTQR